MKHLAAIMARAVEGSGLLAALEGLERSPGHLRVLVYHRVAELDEEPDLDPSLISATPGEFRQQVELLARRYRLVSMTELIEALQRGTPLPPRAVLLTFDDAYDDFQHNAWPVLKEAGLPATLFVPTAYPDGRPEGFWWDRLHAALSRTTQREILLPGVGAASLASREDRRRALKVLKAQIKTLPHDAAMQEVEFRLVQLAEVPPVNRTLSWDALRSLAAAGVDICAHGHAHALMTRLSDEALTEDLQNSMARITQEIPAARLAMAYPANACGEREMAAARSIGFQCAFGGIRGVERTPPQQPFNVMRLPAMRYGAALFRAQLRPSVSRAGRMLVDQR